MACSCADALRWLLLAPAALAGQTAPLPPGLTDRVAAQVAERWNVPAGGLTLDWGTLPPGRAVVAGAPFVLAGRGADGWLSVVFEADAARPVVSVRLRAGVPETLLVATRPLAAGTTLRAGDLRPEVRVHWGPVTASTRLAEPGWEVRRPLAPGEPVIWPAAEPPWLVDTGQPVRVVWSRGAVALSLAGVALHPARAGESVRVRVDGRTQRLVGRVSAAGLVLVADGGGIP
jgi:flagella basal body P-ring formation protein FlgA